MEVQPLANVLQKLRTNTFHESISDGQLLNHFIEQHDGAAFATLVHRHSPMVWGVCRRVVGHHQDAEDAFQAAFLVLARKATSIRPREMLGNWLYGVAYRTALKARTMAAKRQAREQQVLNMPELDKSEQSSWENLAPLLDQELASLPEKYRLAIILCDLEGRTGKMVAQQLKIPEGTLASRLRVARVMLARRLARHGTTLSGGGLATMLAQQSSSAGVPTKLVSLTIKAVTQTTGATAMAGVISAQVVHLTEGVVQAMLLTKLKPLLMVLLILGLGSLGGRLFLRQEAAGQQPASLPPTTDRVQESEPQRRAKQEITPPSLASLQTTRGTAKDQLQRVTYAVADLVIPIIGIDPEERDALSTVKPPKEDTKTRERWLMEKITRMVAPKSWKESGGVGTIEYLPLDKALSVNNSPRVQAQVKYLLETMRRMQDVQIVLETRLLSLSTTGLAKLKEVCSPLKNDDAFVLNELESLGLLRTAETDSATKVLVCPKITLFPSQHVGVRLESNQEWPEFKDIDLKLTAQLAFDLQHMDLSVKATIAKVEFLKSVRVVEGQALVQCQRLGNQYVLAILTPRVLLIVDEDAAIENAIATPDKASKKKPDR